MSGERSWLPFTLVAISQFGELIKCIAVVMIFILKINPLRLCGALYI
jgi:hypothetical protein